MSKGNNKNIIKIVINNFKLQETKRTALQSHIKGNKEEEVWEEAVLLEIDKVAIALLSNPDTTLEQASAFQSLMLRIIGFEELLDADSYVDAIENIGE